MFIDFRAMGRGGLKTGQTGTVGFERQQQANVTISKRGEKYEIIHAEIALGNEAIAIAVSQPRAQPFGEVVFHLKQIALVFLPQKGK